GAPTSVDGIALVDGNRVLVKNQSLVSQNGIYKVVDALNGIWDRATEFDTASEMNLGYRVYVESGTSNGGKTFALDATATTINTSPVNFSVVAANPAVRAATTSNIGTGFSNNQITGVALTGGNLVLDGVTLAVGDRVLVRSQSTAAQNGVYTVTAISGTATLTRAADFNSEAEFPTGIQVFVTEGVRCGGRTFAQASNVTTLNSSSISWTVVDAVTAFDLALTDVLPDRVHFQSLTITTPDVPGGQTFTASGSFSGGSVTVPAVGSSGTITVNLDALAPESKITGSVKDVTIVVNGTVADTAAADLELLNTAKLTFTSLPGPKGTAANPTGTDPTTSSSVDNSGGQYGERNGDGVPSPTYNTAVNYGTTWRNNYSVASTAATSLNGPAVDKSFKDGTLTADDTSLASTSGSEAAIGEQVTYDILVTLPEGTTPDVVVNDLIPAGLRLDSFSVITTASGSARLTNDFNGSIGQPAVGPFPAPGPTTFAFHFGDCTVTADNDPDNNSFVIRLIATVLNVSGNQNGATFANTATARFDDPAIPDRVVPDSNPANDPAITVVEPLLSIDKQVDAALVDAGDEVTYTFTISNSGLQAAYNVTLLDAIPAVINNPTILTGAGDFSATGFYGAGVVAATTADLGATFNPTGGSRGNGSFSGAPPTLDTSVTLADGDLVLVKDQVLPEQNGIYYVSAAAGGDWERWASFDDAAEMLAGYRVRVAGGDTHAGQVWVLMAGVVNVNTDPVNWAYYADVQAPTANDFEISGGTLQVKPSFTLNVPPNGSITLKVKGTVADSIAPGQSIPNTAGLAWTSIQGVSGDERTGADGPGGTLNDYAANSTITSTGRAASFAKSLFSTDQSETADPDVTIGERVTYALKITLPEGTTPDLSVIDHIPAGLKYESYMLVLTAGSSGGLLAKDFAGNVPTPSFSGGGASGDDVTFTFGTITVPDNNDPDDNSFLILVTTRVEDESGNVGSQPGQTTLANNATFDISGDGVPPFTTLDVNTLVVEPRMTIAKNIVQTGADAGDTLDVELTVNNTGLLTAYDVVIEDPLNPAKFNLASVNFGTAGVDYPAGFTPSLVGNTVTYTGGNLPVGGPYLFKFKVALTATVVPGEVINNTAAVTQATTLEGVEPGERNEPPVNASDTVTVFSHGLSGYVYHDPNNNGLKETGESPIGGVTITLTGIDHLGNPVGLSTVSQVNGYYEFTGLRPGTYTLTETQPAGWLDGKETSGTPWTGTVDNAPGSQTISAFSIPPGTPSTMGEDYNFGEIKSAAIGNRIWLDENSDGYQDAGEPGLANVQVNLYDANGNLVAWTLTDANGGYLFTNLAPGTYYVDVLDGTGGQSDTLPFAGMTQTPPSTLPGADFGNQDHGATPIPNTSLTGYQVTVGDGGENLTADFGYNHNPAADVNGNTGAAALGDRVWLDADGDGFQDPGEIGRAGVTVTLYHDPDGDGVYDTPYTVGGYTPTTTTDATGRYFFDSLPAGAYVVRVDDANFQSGGALYGYTQTGDPDHFGTAGTNNDHRTTVPVVLGPGDVFLNADFGYQPPASQNNSVGDYVWLDADADGVQDATEYCIPGVTVALVADLNGNGAWDAGEPIIGTAVADASGGYLFSGLPDAKYLVWVNDTDNVLAGNTQTYDSDGLATPNISAVDLDSAGNSSSPVTNSDQDFGYTPVGQTSTAGLVGDRVW
ncbi:MAG: SdrD B-like domain-containing protein, partial [Verrucomicrobiia bacterium]